jgi:uncharacterized repeat protein (TIGR01451 family)
MLPQLLPRGARRTKSSLELLETRIAPAGVRPLDGPVTQSLPLFVDLALTKTADTDTAQPGDTITYTLHLTNAGTGDATGVTVTDPVVAGLNFVATENPGWSLNQAKTAYVFNYGSLTAGIADAQVTLKLHVSPTVAADVTSVDNSASVSYDLTHGADTNPSNDTGSISVDIVADAILHISVRSETPEIAHGGTVLYSVIYSNTGNRDAHVILTEQNNNLAANFLFDNPGWTYDASLDVYQYDAGIVKARSGNHSVPYVLHASPFIPTTITKLTNSVSIDYAPDAEEEGTASDDTHASVDTPIYQGIYVLSPGTSTPGHFAAPKIQVFDITLGTRKDIQVYPNTVRDSIRTSLGDFNGDGFDDILVTTEHGRGATEVFDGVTGRLMASPYNKLQPFGKNKGSFVAVGNFFPSSPGLDDAPESLLSFPSFGTPDVVFGSALGGGAVKIYSSVFSFPTTLVPSTPIEQLTSTTFYPFGAKFTGGVRVAIADFDGDQRNDLIVAQGNFGNLVKVYSGGDPNQLLASFAVGGPKYKGGLNIAAGDIDNDGHAEIVTGRNRLSAPTVEIFDYQSASEGPGTGTLKGSFNAFSAAYKQGVRVALADVNHDGILDILAGAGYAGRSQVKIFSGAPYSGLKPVTLQLAGDPIFFQPGELLPLPSITPLVVSVPPPVITTVPPLLKSFTALPGNLNQAIWVSATTVVPSTGLSSIIIPPIFL